MTTELEKQFFDTFGIEPKIETNFLCVYDNRPKIRNCQKSRSECENCSDFLKRTIYPQITDRHYLELICLVNERRILPNCNVYELKEYILKELCTMIISESFKHQVQAIFKGER